MRDFAEQKNQKHKPVLLNVYVGKAMTNLSQNNVR